MDKKLFSSFYMVLINLMSYIVITRGLGAAGRKSWSYELKEITSTSSDPEKFKINLEIERVSRGVLGISGDLLINMDIVEGDSNYIRATSYRSAQGGNDYKILPYQMPNIHFFKFLNTYYKDALMDTMKKCSDMPIFDDKFEPPLEKKTYKFNACQLSQDGFPNHLQEGFYKVSVVGSGDVEYQLDVIVEVTTDY